MSNSSLNFFPTLQGKVIIKTATSTTTASSTVNNVHSGWIDTGITITYTPSNANSQLLIFGTVMCTVTAGGVTGFRLDRDGTTLKVSDVNATPFASMAYNSQTTTLDAPISFMYVETTASTSSTTIKVQAKSNQASASNFLLNADFNDDTDVNTVGRFVSTINIWEIL